MVIILGQTVIQKIFAQASGKDHVQVGEIVFPAAYRILSHDNSSAISQTFEKMGAIHVWDPDRVVIVLDHAVPPPDSSKAQSHSIIRNFIRNHQIKHFYEVGSGICHQVLAESGFALPGKLILGADSHTTSYGAFGAFSAGIGRSEVASVWATDKIWLRVPDTIKVELKGTFAPGTFAKDAILTIIGEQGADRANYKALEFCGSAVKDLTLASRLVFANMAAEMGAKNGYFAPDSRAMDFLRQHARADFKPVFSDPDAEYEAVLKAYY